MVKGITQRDLALFKTIGEYGVLSTGQLRALFFKEIRKTTMLRRLRALENRNLIRRIHGLPDGSHGWCLTVNCARTFGICGVFKNINRTSLNHDVTLSEVRLRLKSVRLGDAWVPEHILRYRAWKSRQQRGRVPETIPDGIFTIKKNGEYLAVAVELEMNQKNSERYKKTFQVYQWKKNLEMIWYLVPHASLGKRLESIWNKINNSNPKFNWSLISNVLQKPHEIELHCEGKTILLNDMISSHSGAHPSAQGVSSFQFENTISSEALNFSKA